jgi:hypothetical protein
LRAVEDVVVSRGRSRGMTDGEARNILSR